MKYKYINKYIFLMLALLMIFGGYMQYSVWKSTDNLKKEEINKTKNYARKIITYIKHVIPHDLVKSLDENPSLRKELNGILQAFMTDKYKYIFMLDRKNNKYYRFLLDGSKNSPEEYHSIFFPKSTMYNSVYQNKTIQIVKQKDSIENVWVSVLAPVVYDGKTEALLVLDLSKDYGAYLESFNSPLKNLIVMMQIFLAISVLVLMILFYRYYKFRKHILVDDKTTAYTKIYLEEYFNKNDLSNYHIVMIDIDEFRTVNAKYGYEVGDVVLKEFVTCIKNAIYNYEEDFICRIGGGEFLVVLPSKKAKLDEFVKSLFLRLKEKRYFVKNELIQISISMSAINIPKDTNNLNRVLRVLDEKLLEIKSKGKGDYGIIGTEAKNDIKYRDIDYIRELLENQSLLCYYQPIFDTKSKEIIKYETLVRLYDAEEKKVLKPNLFLDVIRGTSQYIKMSKLVFKDVFATLQKYPDIELSVNLHLDDLYNKDMITMINQVLSTHKEYASRLTFEILEDKEIFDYVKVTDMFENLKIFGSKIAIDDFGSGYANYSYLIKLNVDIIKIDGNIIRELKNYPHKTKEVIKSIKKLADSLGYEVVAEFVSDEIIYNHMLELDIKYSQGFHLGEPKPISEYLD